MNKTFLAPVILPYRTKSHTIIFFIEARDHELRPEAIYISHFQENHGIINPFFRVIVLQVKPKIGCNEKGHARIDHMLGKTEITIKIPGNIIIFCADEGPYGFRLVVHSYTLFVLVSFMDLRPFNRAVPGKFQNECLSMKHQESKMLFRYTVKQIS